MLAGALVATAAVALPAAAERGADQRVSAALTGFNAERVKKVPIVKRSGAKTRVAMSLPPGKVGPVGAGDAVWAGAEIEVSVTCLERSSQCVGSSYRYSPLVKARLVLAGSPKSTSKRNTTPIGRPSQMQCSQELPHRNHHCVLTVKGVRQIKSGGNLPCTRCHVNLLIDARHPNAGGGDVIVVGVDEEHGIAQNKGMLNAVVFDPGPPADVPPVVSKRSAKRRVSVGGLSGNGPKTVIYSRRVNELREGEVLIVTAKAIEKIGHLPYNVLIQSQLVLSEKPGSVSRAGTPGKIASVDGVVTAQNGFNCTQGRSGHSNPCVIRKVGVVKIFKDARLHPDRGEGPFVPLYLNLVVQHREIFAGRPSRHRPGDALKVKRKGGFLEVLRYER
jgi:hypothetical protein